MKKILRDDISNQVIHFTKAENKKSPTFLEDSIVLFDKILTEKRLLGGTGYIKGEYKCICFTEAPVSKLPYIFANRKELDIRYSPYGFMFHKKWLFANGARPVIYGPKQDFYILPESMKYRHVRLELLEDHEIDHTWEREWRLKSRPTDF